MSLSKKSPEVKVNYKLMALLFTGVLMGALDIAIIGPALPAIKSAFKISTRDASWVINIYLLMNMLSAPLMSKLSDIHGRRMIYIIDVALFGIGSVVIALAPDFMTVLIGRAIQGFGSGGIFPVASAVIGDTFPKEKQGSALGLIGAVFGLAFIIGPIIGGLLLMYNWQFIFVINIPIAIVIIYFSRTLVPSLVKTERKKFDLLGTFLLISALAALSIGINRIESDNFLNSILSLQVLPFVIYAVIALPIFYKVEGKVEDGIIKIELLRNPVLRLTFLLGLSAGLAEAAVIFVPSMLTKTFGVSESNASFMLIPMVVAMLIGALISGKATDKIGPRLTLMIAGFLTSLGFIIVGFKGDELYWMYSGGILIGLSLAALLGAPLRFLVNSNTDRSMRASGQGVVTVSTGTGQIISAALLGALITSMGNSVQSYMSSFLYISVIGIFVVFLAFLLPKNNNAQIKT